VATPVPDPVPVPVLALSAARLLNNSTTTAKAGNRGMLQETGTGTTIPLPSSSVAGTVPVLDMAATVSFLTQPAATTLLEAAPDPSPAGELPAAVGTVSSPTEVGTTRGTAAAMAIEACREACREAGTGRGGEISARYPTTG
jgi:hypothetical protein